MGYLLDRAKKKMQGWKEKILSFACKEVLIISVIQHIHVYAMALFKLPKDLLVQTERMIHKFWWTGVNDSSKVHWIRWGKMTKAKQYVGLCFRDPELFEFDQATITKLSWRVIMKSSGSLGAGYKEFH